MTDYSTGPTADDYRDFGEDLVDFAQRAAAPVVDRRIGELQRQLTALQNQALQDRVTRALDNDVVTRDAWRRVNVDPDFLRWLDQVDELAGQTRMRLLQSAYAYGRDDVVLNIFKGYIVGKLPGRTSERLPYEGDRVSTPADANSRQKIWTRPEISRFYENVRRGVCREREGEKLRIEQEILAAASERRVANPPVKNFGDK